MFYYVITTYVDSIYPSELEIKDTTKCSTSDSYDFISDILLKLDTNGKLNTQLYDKQGDFNFSIVNFPYLCNCSNSQTSPAYGVYILQLIRHARARPTYEQVSIRGSLLTKKLMSQGFLQSRLHTALRTFYGRYNDLVCQYNLPLGQMLSDVFHTNR
jgi:hypothetical protein